MSTDCKRKPAAAAAIPNGGVALLRAASWSGSIASLVSMALLAYRGHRERSGALMPVNAPSHWLWRDESLRQRGFTLRHTAVGYLIHHASSVLWATFFERLLLRRPHEPKRVAALALTTAALAAGVDLKLTPNRFTPGFERQLSRKSLVWMYGAFAVGLFGAHVLRHQASARKSSKAGE
jgi:hypothetical protein